MRRRLVIGVGGDALGAGGDVIDDTVGARSDVTMSGSVMQQPPAVRRKSRRSMPPPLYEDDDFNDAMAAPYRVSCSRRAPATVPKVMLCTPVTLVSRHVLFMLQWAFRVVSGVDCV